MSKVSGSGAGVEGGVGKGGPIKKQPGVQAPGWLEAEFAGRQPGPRGTHGGGPGGLNGGPGGVNGGPLPDPAFAKAGAAANVRMAGAT
jgi:hypothetical protein